MYIVEYLQVRIKQVTTESWLAQHFTCNTPGPLKNYTSFCTILRWDAEKDHITCGEYETLLMSLSWP